MPDLHGCRELGVVEPQVPGLRVGVGGKGQAGLVSEDKDRRPLLGHVLYMHE